MHRTNVTWVGEHGPEFVTFGANATFGSATSTVVVRWAPPDDGPASTSVPAVPSPRPPTLPGAAVCVDAPDVTGVASARA